VAAVIEFPRFFDVKSKDLIRKLLNPEISIRLGVSDVKMIDDCLLIGWREYQAS
jgi:hypothetical protein